MKNFIMRLRISVVSLLTMILVAVPSFSASASESDELLFEYGTGKLTNGWYDNGVDWTNFFIDRSHGQSFFLEQPEVLTGFSLVTARNYSNINMNVEIYTSPTGVGDTYTLLTSFQTGPRSYTASEWSRIDLPAISAQGHVAIALNRIDGEQIFYIKNLMDWNAGSAGCLKYSWESKMRCDRRPFISQLFAQGEPTVEEPPVGPEEPTEPAVEVRLTPIGFGAEREGWSWAAATQAVIRHTTSEEVPQCDIVGKPLGVLDCNLRSGSVSDIEAVLDDRGVAYDVSDTPLRLNQIKNEIDGNRVVLAQLGAFTLNGENKNNMFVVINGYTDTGVHFIYYPDDGSQVHMPTLAGQSMNYDDFINAMTPRDVPLSGGSINASWGAGKMFYGLVSQTFLEEEALKLITGDFTEEQYGDWLYLTSLMTHGRMVPDGTFGQCVAASLQEAGPGIIAAANLQATVDMLKAKAEFSENMSQFFIDIITDKITGGLSSVFKASNITFGSENWLPEEVRDSIMEEVFSQLTEGGMDLLSEWAGVDLLSFGMPVAVEAEVEPVYSILSNAQLLLNGSSC